MDMTIEDMCRELQEAAQYEGTELGEAWYNLAELWMSYREYVGGFDFEKSLEAAIRREHKCLKENFRYVEAAEARTYTVRRLERVG